MNNTPGTVSKILWHFTGGPVWDEKKHKQGKKLKPIKNSYSALKSIIKSGELRVGAYHELVKVVIPKKRVYNSELKQLETKTNVPVMIKSSPVCCVADIPIQHLSYHSERYGKIAIGFHRESIVRHGFNPVMYSLENSSLSNSIYDGYSAVDDVDLWYAKSSLEDLENEVQSLIDENGLDDDVSVDNVSSALDDIEYGRNLIRENYENLLAFVKTFETSEFDSIYCEREWRSTKAFEFTTDDIAMIVLPKNVSRKNYYQMFLKATKLPRHIPIVCWEDLIEH